MNFGNISIADCVNVAPDGTDHRCTDPAFALANPDICPVAPTLIVKPAFALTCGLGSIQFRAFYVKNGVETDVTKNSIFTSSDLDVAVVGAISGNATGLSVGAAGIAATYQGLTAQGELTVLGGDHCCNNNKVAMMVIVDNSRSMSQTFGAGYSTRLVFAKAAASRFIGEVNTAKDLVGLERFNASEDVVLSTPSSNTNAVGALVSGIAQTQQKTAFYDALKDAINALNLTSAQIKAIVLISDGEDTTPSYSESTNPIVLLDNFKAGGGIVICLGTRASGKGYSLLSAFATGGFFINSYATVAKESLDFLSGLKGYICAGNCTPTGDTIVAQGQLDYNRFARWNVFDPSGSKTVTITNNWGPNTIEVGVSPTGGISPYPDRTTVLPGQSVTLTSNNYLYIWILSDADPTTILPLPNGANFSGKVSVPLNWPIDAPIISYLPGHVDLIGNGFFDLLPGNGLYVDLAGTAPNEKGLMALKTPFSLASGKQYRVTASLAGNQRLNATPESVRLRVYYLTGITPVYLVDQKITINDFAQNFRDYSFTFTAPSAVSAYISIQQEESPLKGDPRIGLLLGEVKFDNVTDGINLLDDNFDNENRVLIPPRCGTGYVYGYLTSLGKYGYGSGNSCYGTGCLEQPPGVQLPDPSPLPDIESGSTPPKTYTSTKTSCASCPAGTINISAVNLVPAMTSDTAPSGESAASSTQSAATPAWRAFDGVTAYSFANLWASGAGAFPAWLRYKFTAAKIVRAYSLTAWKQNYSGPKNFQLQGSNDGSAWTTLDTRSNMTWFLGETKTFTFTNATAYLYYRLYVTAAVTQGSNPNIVAVGELQLFEVSPIEICKEATETSEVSQADADNKARATALAAAQALLTCTTIYTSTQQYTAKCSTGAFGSDVTKSATATSLVSQAEADAAALAQAKSDAEAELDCTKSNNTQQIVIHDAISGTPVAATPYPSVKYVSGQSGVITKVTVAIKKFTHTSPDDVYLILRHPDGTAVALMRNCGGSNSVANLDFTFDDAAGSFLPDATVLSSGTFKPSQYGVEVALPVPAPQPPSNATLAAFNGKTPNGSWSLWVADDTPIDVGSISQGWDLTITSA